MNPWQTNMAKGIDISHWKPVKDWKALREAVSFVGIKATEGNTVRDPMFYENQKAMQEQDFILGIYYHFARTGDPIAQARRFMATVGALKPNERLALDFEVLPENYDPLGWMTAFIKTVMGTVGDRRPLLYTSDRIWKQMGNPFMNPLMGWVQDVDLWLPRYSDDVDAAPAIPCPWHSPPSTAPEMVYTPMKFWQFSENQPVPGCGQVDANVFNGDQAALEAYAADLLHGAV